MSYSYDRYERNARRQAGSSHRGTFSYWLPLVLTVTAATVGIAAWIWSERNDDEEEPHPPPTGPSGGLENGRASDGIYNQGPPSFRSELRPGEAGFGTTPQQPTRPEENQSYMARMSGALRRTPSPQQFMEGAGRTVVAGVAAAGAVVGSALSSIREEDKNAYKDHKTWSEEAEARSSGASPALQPIAPAEVRSTVVPGVAPTARVPVTSVRRRTVAVVVSADTSLDFDDEEGSFHEHASILSHLPHKTDFSKIRLFVLIYAPHLKEHPLDAMASRPIGSLSSSFSNIGHEQTHTPGDEAEKTLYSSPASPAFNAVYSQALSLVEKETMVLPFTTPTGHLHILRHLGPEIVYLQESMSGHNGDNIMQLQSWLRHDVVLVVGADGGHGGLADSESEAEQVERKEHWWEKEDRVGRGRGVVVVEGLRIGDDWARRVENRE